jgi:hypothetical protein
VPTSAEIVFGLWGDPEVFNTRLSLPTTVVVLG